MKENVEINRRLREALDTLEQSKEDVEEERGKNEDLLRRVKVLEEDAGRSAADIERLARELLEARANAEYARHASDLSSQVTASTLT